MMIDHITEKSGHLGGNREISFQQMLKVSFAITVLPTFHTPSRSLNMYALNKKELS